MIVWTVIAIVVPMFIPGMLAKLMNIPLRAAKKKFGREKPGGSGASMSTATLVKAGITTTDSVGTTELVETQDGAPAKKNQVAPAS